MRLSSPFRSADGRTMYAVDRQGTRYRVQFDGPRIETVPRQSKAEKKAAKKWRMRARRTS